MPNKILVSGLVNIENTLRVEKFPLEYFPVTYPFHGVRSTVSGVGANVAKALTALGADAVFLSIIGTDGLGDWAANDLQRHGVKTDYLARLMPETAQSVVLYDGTGRRQIHVDLKELQETAYPPGRFDAALRGCGLAALCNINFSRPFLKKARAAGAMVATDVHVLSDLNDPYNGDFMEAADVLFLSDEGLSCPPEEFARALLERYGCDVVVIGMGPRGACLYRKGGPKAAVYPAVRTREVVNTIGAGDALFSAFVFFYNKTRDAELSLKKAQYFASWKIGEKSAADGFLSEKELGKLVDKGLQCS